MQGRWRSWPGYPSTTPQKHRPLKVNPRQMTADGLPNCQKLNPYCECIPFLTMDGWFLYHESLRPYSLCCWSPWRGCYTWRRRPPRVRSPWPRGWRHTRSETSRTRSTLPRSCAPAQCLHTRRGSPVYNAVFLLKVIGIVYFNSPFDV